MKENRATVKEKNDLLRGKAMINLLACAKTGEFFWPFSPPVWLILTPSKIRKLVGDGLSQSKCCSKSLKYRV